MINYSHNTDGWTATDSETGISVTASFAEGKEAATDALLVLLELNSEYAEESASNKENAEVGKEAQESE